MALKLLGVIRSIGIFDLKTGKQLRNIKIDISVTQINSAMPVVDGDIDFCDHYKLDETNVKYITDFCTEAIEIDTTKYLYVLLCDGIYDTSHVKVNPKYLGKDNSLK